jgi:hypothetical protein
VCARWYAAYPLSFRNIEEMMGERGVFVDHSTLHHWSIKMLPVLTAMFRRRKRPVGRSWRMDETYVKVSGQWKYLCRAVDRDGDTVDFCPPSEITLRPGHSSTRCVGSPENRSCPSKAPGIDTRQPPASAFSTLAGIPSAVLAAGPFGSIRSGLEHRRAACPGLVQQTDQIAASRDLSSIVRLRCGCHSNSR